MLVFRRRCRICNTPLHEILARHERQHVLDEYAELKQAREQAQALLGELRGAIGETKRALEALNGAGG